MIMLYWLDEHHVYKGSLQGAIERANQLYLKLSVAEKGEWFVHSGEDLIFKSDSREALDAFLYGLGLAYSLPEEVFEVLREQVRNLVE